MPTLPKPLRRPHPWLGLLLLGTILVTVDVMRAPADQFSPRVYRCLVGVYQWAKPRCGFAGVCRYNPSCSHYSVQAVKQFGLIDGLQLTAERLDRCRANVPKGTLDPIPNKQ
jgi:putative component of membrane protein insertase Oxa1/YidC/SpoIIIJ protein YidD